MNIDGLTRQSEEVSALMGLLANPHRLRILCELLEGEHSVGELETVIGLSQSALSQHLAKLRSAGAVRTRREAQTIFYSLSDKRLSKLLAVMHELFCSSPVTGKTRKAIT